ncbi:MAG: serine/threonine protein kinase, partial [Anaerolineales bacterium]|nr:serine/threonine protein kinase [Anaerolineales bacterium]
MPLSTGKILNDRYRIVKLLGEGGFGAVYRAWDMNLRGPCAVKENFDSSPEAQSQFAREASILYNLRHPNLPKVIDHFSIPGQGQYLVMEYIEGQDLQEMIDAGTEDQAAGVPLPEERVLAWAQQVCDALIYLHSRKPPIIHRDIKPANIRISPEGMANLVDFGIAKVYDPERKTTLGARAVTPGFAPFEQYGQRPTDARTDVYALGATLYASLTGQAPMESIERVGGGRLPSPRELNPSISKGVDAAIMRAMEIMPDQRFQSMADFKHALLPGGAAVFAAGVSAGVASEPVPSQYTSVGVQPSGESTQARGDEAPPAGKAKKISRRWILFGALAGLILTCIFCTILGSLGEQDRAAGVSKTAKALT